MKPILEVIADAVGDYEGADPVHDRLCAEHIVGHLRDAGYVIVPLKSKTPKTINFS